jgi:hypothetical protein
VGSGRVGSSSSSSLTMASTADQTAAAASTGMRPIAAARGLGGPQAHAIERGTAATAAPTAAVQAPAAPPAEPVKTVRARLSNNPGGWVAAGSACGVPRANGLQRRAFPPPQSAPKTPPTASSICTVRCPIPPGALQWQAAWRWVTPTAPCWLQSRRPLAWRPRTPTGSPTLTFWCEQRIGAGTPHGPPVAHARVLAVHH